MNDTALNDSPQGGSLLQRPPAWRRLMSSQLRLNFASGIATTAVNVLVMSASYPLYLHFLGYEKLGVWLLLSTVQAIAQFGLFGIGPALTKLVAEEHGRGNLPAAQQYVAMASFVVCATGALALAAVTLFRVPIVHALGITGANGVAAIHLLPWVGVLTLCAFFSQVVTGALAGFGRMDVSNYCVTASKLIVLGAEVILLWRGVGLATLLIGDLLGCAFVLIVGAVVLRRIGRVWLMRFGAGVFDFGRLKKLLSFGGAIFSLLLASMLISPLNKMILSRFAGLAVVPIYDIAYNGSEQLRNLIDAGLRALMPEVSRAHGAVSTGAAAAGSIRRLYARSLLAVIALAIPFYGLIAAFTTPVLKVWLRGKFDPRIVPLFLLMALASFISLIAVPAYHTLMGTGRLRKVVASHLISSLTSALIVLGIAHVKQSLTLPQVGGAVVISTLLSSVYLLFAVRPVLREPQQAEPAGFPVLPPPAPSARPTADVGAV